MSKAVQSELLAIKNASRDGMLHAEKVVEWAKKHKQSALHRKFEWNDSKAAREYRLWQARVLIQLNITTQDGGPQLVSLSIDRTKGGGYRDLDDVRRDKNLSAVLLNDALNELRRVQDKYKRVRALAKVWHAVDSVAARSQPSERKKAA